MTDWSDFHSVSADGSIKETHLVETCGVGCLFYAWNGDVQEPCCNARNGYLIMFEPTTPTWCPLRGGDITVHMVDPEDE